MTKTSKLFPLTQSESGPGRKNMKQFTVWIQSKNNKIRCRPDPVQFRSSPILIFAVVELNNTLTSFSPKTRQIVRNSCFILVLNFGHCYAQCSTAVIIRTTLFYAYCTPIYASQFWSNAQTSMKYLRVPYNNTYQTVVCLRGEERTSGLKPPLFGGPSLRCYTLKFSPFFGEKLIIQSYNTLQSRSCASTLLSKGPCRETVMCKYFAFKGVPTAIEMRKYSAFQLHWRGP